MRSWAAQEAGVQLGIDCCHYWGLELTKEYCGCIGVSFFEGMDLEGLRLECTAHRGTSAGQTSRPFDFSDDGFRRHGLRPLRSSWVCATGLSSANALR